MVDLASCLGPGNEAHCQASLVLHGLLGQVVGLPDVAEVVAAPRAQREASQERHQDGLHHHHGDVLAHAGAWTATEGLEETTRHLRRERERKIIFSHMG